MSKSSKVWDVHDREIELGDVLVRAASAKEAISTAIAQAFGEAGCERENLEVERVPWLDGYDNLNSSDAAEEMKLHGWQDGPWHGEKDAETHGLTMPIDTLADAIDWSQCDMWVREDYTRSLDVSSLALVDIAVSLRALSGRPPVTDTPMQQRMREAIDKGEDPRKKGLPPATRYIEAFKRAYKPRTATNPRPSADSTGKQQEDGKESVSEHSGVES